MAAVENARGVPTRSVQERVVRENCTLRAMWRGWKLDFFHRRPGTQAQVQDHRTS